MSLPIRPDLVQVPAYGAPQLDVPVRLNTNENPFSPPTALVAEIGAAVTAAASGLNRYPDRDFRELRAALADYLGHESGVALSGAEIWAANGSNEVMLQLLQAFGGPGRKVLVFSPTYSMYEEYARTTHTSYVEVEREADFSYDAVAVARALTDHQPEIVVFTSPNNPTGTAIADLQLVESALQSAPNSLVIVDEAYAEFRRPGVESALTLLHRHPNLVVVRTMSKAFAMAGLRLGYCAAHPKVLDEVLKVRLPYHLSTVTQVTALCALRHADQLQKDLAALRSQRDELVEWLRAIGLQAADSDTNFVLFGRFADRHAVWQELVECGVLIREVGPDGWLRVTVGTPVETELFKSALAEIVRGTR